MSKVIVGAKNAKLLKEVINRVSPASAIEEIIISLEIAEKENCFSIDGLIERIKQLPRNK